MPRASSFLWALGAPSALAWALFGGIVGSACAGSGGGGRPVIAGRLVDPEGAPLADVKVFTEPPTDRVLSGLDGRFEITRVMPGSSVLPEGIYRVHFQKDGFVEPESPVLAKLGGSSVELGTIEVSTDDGLRVPPAPPVSATDAGDAAAAGGEVGRGL